MKLVLKQTGTDYDEIKWEGGATTFRERCSGRWFIPASTLLPGPLLIAASAQVPALLDADEIYLPFDWLKQEMPERKALFDVLEQRLAAVKVNA